MLSFFKQYDSPQERQAEMERLLIEVNQLKTPEGKFFHVPQMLEIGNIYQQAEAELLKHKP